MRWTLSKAPLAEEDVAASPAAGTRFGALTAVRIFLLVWLALAAILAVFNAWDVISKGSIIAIDFGGEGLNFTLPVLGVAVGVIFLWGMFVPGWWRRIFFVTAILPVLAVLITSRTVPAALAFT